MNSTSTNRVAAIVPAKHVKNRQVNHANRQTRDATATEQKAIRTNAKPALETPSHQQQLLKIPIKISLHEANKKQLTAKQKTTIKTKSLYEHMKTQCLL